MTAVHVAVNLMWCLPGEVGGSEQYLVRQLLGVTEAAADPANGCALELSVYVPPSLPAARPELADVARVVPMRFDGHRRWRRVVSESTWLRVRTGREDLVHHGGGTAPIGARRPYLLTVHDLQYRTFPEWFSATKRRYLDAMIPRSVRHAAVVAVPSEYVRGRVSAEFDVPPERVHVVPHGYEPALLAERTSESVLRERYRLGRGRVVVYPAITHPHKNHPFLVDLMRTVWADPELRLVLLGGTGAGEQALVDAMRAAGSSVTDRIVRPGRVTDADRNGLLAMSTALVFPSRYEGFGAPLIEAMALGAPVICSDATCIPDVVGDAGIVRPLDAESWAGAIEEAVARKDDLVAAGRRRVESFTSRRSGEALLSAYRAVLAA
jgi:glycosyltransferase involved in cell wall biosynthesis